MNIISKDKFIYIKREFLQDIGGLGSFPVHVLLIIFLLSRPATLYLGLLNLIGFISTILIAYLIRIVYFKERPNKRTYTTLLEKIDASSFPSIHTARSFCFAIITGYSVNLITLSLLILIAVIIGYSRISLKYHHKSDVYSGAILGIFLATIILSLS